MTDVETLKSGDFDGMSDDDIEKPKRRIHKRGPAPDSVLSKNKKPRAVKVPLPKKGKVTQLIFSFTNPFGKIPVTYVVFDNFFFVTSFQLIIPPEPNDFLSAVPLNP